MRISTKDQVKNEIVTAIEAGGEAKADDYDIDAIVEEAYAWKVDHNEDGAELLNTAGWEQTVDETEFWAIVAKHEIKS